MKLKELKQMIKEEYSRFLEQDTMSDPMGGPMPGGAPGGMPSIDVGPGDIDAMGEDAEGTLRSIFDMLKSYFEGGDNMAADIDMGMDMGMDDDMDDMAAPKG